jgi:hypothetical protein
MHISEWKEQVNRVKLSDKRKTPIINSELARRESHNLRRISQYPRNYHMGGLSRCINLELWTQKRKHFYYVKETSSSQWMELDLLFQELPAFTPFLDDWCKKSSWCYSLSVWILQNLTWSGWWSASNDNYTDKRLLITVSDHSTVICMLHFFFFSFISMI